MTAPNDGGARRMDAAQAERFALLARETHNEIREILNRRIRAANEAREFGVGIMALYAALRMTSAQLLLTMQAAGVAESDAIAWARAAEKGVRDMARAQPTEGE